MQIISDELKSLKNSGELEFVFIGVGTAFSPLLYNNNMIIIKGNNHVVVDFGFTAPIAYSKFINLSPLEIENILLTHCHADHIGGVEYLALYNRYVGTQAFGKSKIKLITTKVLEKILWEESLRGGLQWNEFYCHKKMDLSEYFDIKFAEEIEHSTRLKYFIKFDNIDIELFQTNHIPDTAQTFEDNFTSYGLFIDNRILYTSDTKFDLELINEYGNRAEYIFHDCSFTNNPVHASLEELKQLPEEIKRKLILMHYSENGMDQDFSEFCGLAMPGLRYRF